MKKLLIVGCTSTVGGIETLFKGLFEIKNDCFDISFLCFDNECAFSDIYKKNDYKIIVLPSRRKNPLLFNKNIKTFFRTNTDFDYIWVNTSSTSMYQIQYYGKKFTRAKIITHSHGTNFDSNSGKLLYCLNRFLGVINRRKVIKSTDLFFACSLKAGIALFGEENKEKIQIIRNGIDAEKFQYSQENREKLREELHIKNDTYAVAMVGRLSEQKNTIRGIDIFNSIIQEYKNAQLLIVGEGKLRQTVENRVNTLKLQEHVQFLGLRNDVHELFSAIDLLLMPSLFEGLPLTAIEAQAAGCPCVLSDSITKEVDIGGTVRFMDLRADNTKWARQILEVLNSYEHGNRKEGVRIVRIGKYDKKDTLKFIETFL
ncbi:MAG: glycosyltransferase [Clostridia bacterium]|nr:glycosyltransferase [Clostridia bacterium]